MTRVRKSKAKARRRASADAQLEEFETKDLGADIEVSGAGVVIRPQRPTSILLGDDLIAKLRAKGAKRGLPYQTMLKMIVREHVDEY
jgi:predicted DNA binding CopG/RHH family protein